MASHFQHRIPLMCQCQSKICATSLDGPIRIMVSKESYESLKLAIFIRHFYGS